MARWGHGGQVQPTNTGIIIDGGLGRGPPVADAAIRMEMMMRLRRSKTTWEAHAFLFRFILFGFLIPFLPVQVAPPALDRGG